MPELPAIFLLEDDPVLAGTLIERLGRRGASATAGEDLRALKEALADRLDVLLVNPAMPLAPWPGILAALDSAGWSGPLWLLAPEDQAHRLDERLTARAAGRLDRSADAADALLGAPGGEGPPDDVAPDRAGADGSGQAPRDGDRQSDDASPAANPAAPEPEPGPTPGMPAFQPAGGSPWPTDLAGRNVNQVFLDAMPCRAMLLDADGQILAANRQAISEGFAIGSNCCDAASCPYGPANLCLRRQALASETPVQSEMDDAGRIVEAHWVRLSPELCLCYAFDVTEKRKAERRHAELERRAQEAQKMEAIGQLAGGIAHDFNNLLTGIMGYAQMLQDRAERPEEVCQYAQLVLQTAERAGQLTRKLLNFTRRQHEPFMKLSMHRLLHETIQLLKPSCKNITVELDDQAGRDRIEGDVSQLQTALLNLGLNARDAIDPPGRVTFRTSDGVGPGGDPALLIEVEDTGSGMDKPTLERIFQPLFTTKAPDKGTGLGLSSVRQTIQAHQGRITARSTPGAGTTFTIVLPLRQRKAVDGERPACDSAGWAQPIAEEPADHAAGQTASPTRARTDARIATRNAPGTGPGDAGDGNNASDPADAGDPGEQSAPGREAESNRQTETASDRPADSSDQTGLSCPVTQLLPSPSERVLLVDDDDVVRELARCMLEEFGYEVHSFASASRAVGYFADHADQVDLVISDIVMPEMDGWEVFHRVRQTAPHARVLFITGYAAGLDFSKAFDEGLLGVVHKPFHMEEFRRAVQRALRSAVAA